MLARLLIVSAILTLVCIGLALRPLRPALAALRSRRTAGARRQALPRQPVIRRLG